jgi:hypothetical protein
MEDSYKAGVVRTNELTVSSKLPNVGDYDLASSNIGPLKMHALVVADVDEVRQNVDALLLQAHNIPRLSLLRNLADLEGRLQSIVKSPFTNDPKRDMGDKYESCVVYSKHAINLLREYGAHALQAMFTSKGDIAYDSDTLDLLR